MGCFVTSRPDIDNLAAFGEFEPDVVAVGVELGEDHYGDAAVRFRVELRPDFFSDPRVADKAETLNKISLTLRRRVVEAGIDAHALVSFF